MLIILMPLRRLFIRNIASRPIIIFHWVAYILLDYDLILSNPSHRQVMLTLMKLILKKLLILIWPRVLLPTQLILSRVHFLLALGPGVVQMVETSLSKLVLIGNHDPMVLVSALFR